MLRIGSLAERLLTSADYENMKVLHVALVSHVRGFQLILLSNQNRMGGF